MSADICFRQIKKKDYEFIQKILARTWDLSEYTKNKKLIKLISKHYLYLYLSKTNYAVVASKKGKAVGALFARTEKNYSVWQTFIYKIKKLFLSFILFFTKGGRVYLTENRIIRQADKSLREKYKRKYGAELVLFIVNSHYKGQGIGSGLLNKFVGYLKKKKINTYYLYTDDYCDVDYYIKHNYTELGKKEVKLEDDDPSLFYIFSYNIRNNAKFKKLKSSQI